MKKAVIFTVLIGLLSLAFMPGLAKSSELIFQFTNPSFGGNPLNGSFLLQQAQAQNKFREKTPETSLLEQLNPMYQAQFLSKILEDAYENGGTNIQPGEYIIGGLIINVTKEPGKLTLLVTDPATGQRTTYQVPIP
ncbi:MAG: curli assembly protein CsgF [Thermodesulfovibrio sp.]|nr:curli assembly protein CsgF [Thermodesulfovibrio sp.]